MPLVTPLPADHDAEIGELARFFRGTLGFAPNSVLTMMRRAAMARAGWRRRAGRPAST